MHQITDLASGINILVGVVIPLLVGVIAKAGDVNRTLRTMLNAFLSASAGVLTAWLANPNMTWESVSVSIFLTFTISIASHYGFWKPTGVTNAVQSSTPNFLLGTSVNITEDNIDPTPTVRSNSA